MTSGERNSDLIGGILGLVLAGAFWFAREDNWSFWSAVFPNVMIVIIAVLSVLLLIKAFVRPAMMAVFQDGDRSKMLITSLLLIAWGFAFSWLGALASSFLAFAVLTIYLGKGHFRPTPAHIAAGLAIIVAELAVLYLLFTRVLYVPLPRGLLF